MSNFTIDELAAELEAFAPPEKPQGFTTRQERIITGFEEITEFIAEHAREPVNRPGNDIFERMLAVRLEALRKNDEVREFLIPFDEQKILNVAETPATDDLSVEELAAALGGDEEASDITRLTYVSSGGPRNTPDEVAVRRPAEHFHRYEEAFKRVAEGLRTGSYATREFTGQRDIVTGGWYIVGGLLAHVAKVGEEFESTFGQNDARLHVIFSNATESNLLLRSLTKAMNQPPLGRVVGVPNASPLFGSEAELGDTETGTIYVLRSKSQHPVIREHGEYLHKIGVTSGSVERRVANAHNDPTYLMAGVEIVATYKVLNMDPGKLERLIHKIFSPARLDVQLKDRFGRPIVPREWFLVPLKTIQEVVQRIIDGSIVEYVYDPAKAALVKDRRT